MIALLCSVPFEAELLLSAMANQKTTPGGSKSMVQGTIGVQQVVLCSGGMGKVNAAHAATLLLTRYAPELILVFGIGGAYPGSGAAVGDVVIASEEIAGDEGVLTRDGFHDTEYLGIPLVKTAASVLFNSFPAPAGLVDRARQGLAGFTHPGRVLVGKFVTLSSCTGTSERAGELDRRLQGLRENMEGAAVAQVAALHAVPWLEIRSISNRVENRDLKQWDIPKAAATVQNAVMHLLRGWHGQ
jgi:futalosine hydrolase